MYLHKLPIGKSMELGYVFEFTKKKKLPVAINQYVFKNSLRVAHNIIYLYLVTENKITNNNKIIQVFFFFSFVPRNSVERQLDGVYADGAKPMV